MKILIVRITLVVEELWGYLTLYLSGWLLIAFSKGAWSLDIGRLAVGCAMGNTVYVVPMYIAEITPKNLRGGSVLLHQFMLCCGIALV
ncbi:hypothetical protein BVRB_5g112460 [Beta vulgaris subsp. vulgaris]|nr:hypothetical protein BVRB_5g112460 [Beta vulgaris subsp. vulgaris]